MNLLGMRAGEPEGPTPAGRVAAGVACSTVDCPGELALMYPPVVHPQLLAYRRAECPVCGLRWWVESPDGRVVSTIKRGWMRGLAAWIEVRRNRHVIIRTALQVGAGGGIGAAVLYFVQRMG